MATIVYATRNLTKMGVLRMQFLDAPHNVLSMEEAAIIGIGEESATTLEDNTWIKARFVSSQVPHYWVMADSTGLFIDYMDSRLNGVHPMKVTRYISTSDIMKYVSEHTGDIDFKTRVVTLTTFVVLIPPLGTLKSKDVIGWSFVENMRGHIHPTINDHDKSVVKSYDSIFCPLGTEKTISQMSVQEKNTLTDRSKVLRNVKSFLDRYHPNPVLVEV